MWDVFICHASEDKESLVRPLAVALRRSGLEVWYDEFTLYLGDSLRQSVDRGLAKSRFGVVVLSPHFFGKQWAQMELDGLVSRETSSGQKVILPIWHNVDQAYVAKYSPILAGKYAARTAMGIGHVVQEILRVVRPNGSLTMGQESLDPVSAIEAKIGERGHWRIHVLSADNERERFSLADLPDMLSRSRITLRGWDYPHFDEQDNNFGVRLDCVELATDWREHKELLRFHQSGQFLHLMACREDWLPETRLDDRLRNARPFLDVPSVVYTLTELHEFLSCLSREGLYESGAEITIGLHNMSGRRLAFYDPLRELYRDYMSREQDIVRRHMASAADLSAAGSEMALDSALWFLHRFGWLRAPRDVLGQDQTRLLNRQL